MAKREEISDKLAELLGLGGKVQVFWSKEVGKYVDRNSSDLGLTPASPPLMFYVEYRSSEPVATRTPTQVKMEFDVGDFDKNATHYSVGRAAGTFQPDYTWVHVPILLLKR